MHLSGNSLKVRFQFKNAPQGDRTAGKRQQGKEKRKQETGKAGAGNRKKQGIGNRE
jgi:hypothetical protein